jgi:hypothetical protein
VTTSFGRFTLFTSNIDDDLEREMVKTRASEELERARVAFDAGNPAALAEALKLIRDVPESSAAWVLEAAIAEARRLGRPAPVAPGGGRSANPRGRLRADAADLTRYLCVVRAMLIDAPSRPWAAALTALRKHGHSLAGVTALKASYRRCVGRLQLEPERYYPFVEWARSQVAQLMMAAPEPRSEWVRQRIDAHFPDAPDRDDWRARSAYMNDRLWTLPEIVWRATEEPGRKKKKNRAGL